MKEGPSESKENKENREKKGDREASKGRAAASRKGKGGSRTRQGMDFKRDNLQFSVTLSILHHYYISVVFPLRSVCPCAARPEENGVEVTPADRGPDRGRRARGGRGEHPHVAVLSACPRLEWMLLTFV